MKKALRKRSLEVLGTNTDPGPGVFTMNPSEPVESGPSELEFLVALVNSTKSSGSCKSVTFGVCTSLLIYNQVQMCEHEDKERKALGNCSV